MEPKDNFYSVGRLYGFPPKEIAKYNNLDFEKGLIMGTTIKVPLTATNFSQSDSGALKLYQPVYHIVQPGESLSKISANYNKVSPTLLKKWNRLKTNAVTKDSKLLVGYLKVAKGADAIPIKKTATDTGLVKKDKKKAITDSLVIKDKKKGKAAADSIALKKDKKKGKPGADSVAIKNKKKVKPARDSVVTKPVVKKEEKEVVTDTASPTKTANFYGGVFRRLYEEQAKGKTEMKEAGASGIFKSISGWQDGKYYCFHNAAAQGSIIKVTNNATGKSIYAKVLDVLPDIKQNEGLLLQLSNAAGEELGVSGRFDCTISYYK